VLKYLLKSYLPVVNDEDIASVIQMGGQEWLDFADQARRKNEFVIYNNVQLTFCF
jgi:hypothetical protein